MEDQRYLGIVRQYRHILTFISRYLVIFFALGMAFFVFKNFFLDPNYISEREDPFFLKKIELIGKFENMLKQAQQGTDIKAQIIQGPLQTKDQVILSQDNLITYKGIVAPRYFTLNLEHHTIKPLSYFSSTKYDTGELERTISALIFTPYVALPPVIKNTQLPVDTSLTKSFNLSCIFTNKLYPSTCNYYIQNFLSSFFVFNLSLDYEELTNIFSHLQNTPQHVNHFCTTLQKYLLYTNDANQAIKKLFDQCPQDTKDFFKKMENFINIQNQLEQGFINTDVYKDPYLNAYKLLSYQQILYHDMQENRVLYNQYSMYLNFVRELLKTPNKLDRFYYDEMYRFTSHYLKPSLQGTRYESRIGGIKDEQINSIIKLIDIINEGDDLGEFTGLISWVSNKKILTLAPIYSGAQVEIPLQEKIIKKLKYISFLEVDPPVVYNNQFTLSGSFLIGDTKVATTLQITYQDDTFYVRSMHIPGYPRLVTALKTLFTDKKVSVGDLYGAITKNFSFYQNNDSLQSGKLLDPCEEVFTLQPSLGIHIDACTPDHVALEKKISGSSGIQTVHYTIFLTNYIPNTVTVSDTQLQKNINDRITVQEASSLSGLIRDIVAVPFRIITPYTGGNEGTSTTITILEMFKKYLGITPRDIAEKDKKILIDFSLGTVDFLAYYKMSTHELSPIYFKKVASSETPLMIQGLSLTLDDLHSKTIQSFVADPINYIKNVDVTARRNYVAPPSSTKQP